MTEEIPLERSADIVEKQGLRCFVIDPECTVDSIESIMEFGLQLEINVRK
jgi:hypothetical protein